MKRTFFVLLLMMTALVGFSQTMARRNPNFRKSTVYTDPSKSVTPPTYHNGEPIHVVYARVENGDTALIVYLPEVDIDLLSRFYEFSDTRHGRRLVSNVKKVYPYAKTAALKLQEFDSIMARTTSPKAPS